MVVTERAVCFECGWQGDSCPIGSDIPSKQLDEHKRTCAGKPADEKDDTDQDNPQEFTEGYDWSKHDWDNDPDWR